jgi:hypothetical protein
MHYNARDIQVLRALVRGIQPEVDSEHRLRLEMMRLVVDGSDGLRLTPAGAKAVSVLPALLPAAFDDPPARRPHGRQRRLDRTYR